ncbi:MAG TPA: SPOR domain-containing protein [Polyangiaceae bacterium]|nr:MAG: cell division protein FtsN [Deltaproteobacteria bacterium ADurb.Bin207]HNS95314.1 SPOR domain-containing protein [Polyangiaceae bacterium]HNZ23150.1 SPOR domain-containing protein [Polyangiaceae bacterium]HOD22119.1 SPOR domain-containing protein [Polyangiaceae bacterium]HOE50884.1 SPOR domain-containing protein [Polyangiaceae bacterium]
MTTHDTLAPIAAPPPPPRYRRLKWLWIPAILAAPIAVWGIVYAQRPEPQRSSPHALQALVPRHGEPLPTPAVSSATAAHDPSRSGMVAEEAREAQDDLAQEQGSTGGEQALNEGEESEEIASEEDEAREQKPKSATVSEGKFWIQLASLPLRENAERLAAKLRKRGHDAQAMAYGGPSAGWWHVVRLGPYESRMDAEKARLDFVKAEPMKTEVIPRARGEYQIQLASVRSEKQAQTLVRRLSRQGHPAALRTINTAKGVWYAVRVGPFDSKQDAIGYRHLLEEYSHVTGDLLPREKFAAPLPDAEDESDSADRMRE